MTFKDFWNVNPPNFCENTEPIEAQVWEKKVGESFQNLRSSTKPEDDLLNLSVEGRNKFLVKKYRES